MMIVNKYKIDRKDCKVVDGVLCYRITATRSFGKILSGQKGGFIEHEGNLSQVGSAWITQDACVQGRAMVLGSATVNGHAVVTDHAVISDDAYIGDSAFVCGHAIVKDRAIVRGRAVVSDNAYIVNRTLVFENATISGNAVIEDTAIVGGTTIVTGTCVVSEHVKVSGKLRLAYGNYYENTIKSVVLCALNMVPINDVIILFTPFSGLSEELGETKAHVVSTPTFFHEDSVAVAVDIKNISYVNYDYFLAKDIKVIEEEIGEV